MSQHLVLALWLAVVAVRANFGTDSGLPWTTEHYIGGEPFSSSAFTVDGRSVDTEALKARKATLNERLLGLGPENLKALKALREDGLRVKPHWIDISGVYEKRKLKWSNMRDRGSPPVHPAALDPGVKLLTNLTMSGSKDSSCIMEVLRKDCSALFFVRPPQRQDTKTMFGQKKKKQTPGRARSNSAAKRYEKSFTGPLREDGFTMLDNVLGSIPNAAMKDMVASLLNNDTHSKAEAPGVRSAYQPFEMHPNLTSIVCKESLSEMFKSYSVNQAQFISSAVYRVEAGAALSNGLWTAGGWGGYRLQLLVPLDTTEPIVAVAKRSHRVHLLHAGLVQWEKKEIEKDLDEINELAAGLGGGIVIHSNMIHRYIPQSKAVTIAVFEFGEMKRKFKPLEKMGCLPPNMHLMMLNTVEQVQEYCPDWYIDMTKQALAMVGISGLSGQQYGLVMASGLIGIVFLLVFFFVDPAASQGPKRTTYQARTGFTKRGVGLRKSGLKTR